MWPFDKRIISPAFLERCWETFSEAVEVKADLHSIHDGIPRNLLL